MPVRAICAELLFPAFHRPGLFPWSSCTRGPVVPGFQQRQIPMAGGRSKQGFQRRFLLMLSVCPPGGCSPLRVTWDLTGGTRTCLACSCLLPETWQDVGEGSEPPATSPEPLSRCVILGCFFCFLICWI